MSKAGRRGAARDALRATEERFRALFENSPISIWEEDFSEVGRLLERLRRAGVGDLDAHLREHPEVVARCAEAVRIVDVNRAAVTLHRAVSKEELLAGLLATFTPESLGTFRRELLALWEGKTELVSDAVVRTLAGERRDVTVHFAVSPGHERTLSRVLVSLVDVTERRRAEEALRESERRYREVFDNVSDSIFVVDVTAEGRFRFAAVNGAAERISGIKNAELRGRWLEEGVRPEVVAHVLPHWRRCVETATPLQYVDEYSRASDGRRFHLDSSLVPLRGADGVVVRLLVVSRDVTEQKNADDAIRRAELRYRQVFENASDVIYLLEVTEDGRFRNLDVNPAFERSVGLTAAQVLGKYQEETVPAETARIVNAKYRGCVEAGKAVQEEVVLDLPTGRKTYRSTLIPIRDGAGRVYRIVGLSRDVSDQVRAEAEIRDLNLDLERRVKDRTAQLEAAKDEIEAFAYSVSHDLRAPLRHIDGFAGLLRSQAADALDEQARHYLGAIEESARRMGALIDDLLSFSRMGRCEMAAQEVDLGALVAEVIREVGAEAPGRVVHWKVAELPDVTGDRAMLRLVLVNLLSNALKFTRPRPHAEIEVGARPGEGGEVVFSVHDNGVGFDMRYAAKVFGVFQRLHRPEEFEGTGIGLASVRRIVGRHGGRTWCEGMVDGGATFYFSLPGRGSPARGEPGSGR